MPAPLEFGLDTFGDVTKDAAGAPLAHAHVIRNIVDEAVLADELGLDFIGLGEHHRADFAISSPETVLAAIAARTRRIHLGSAVTVLSSDDPIRVFQRFATLDALSNGRAERILGRGTFTGSFPLFGYDLADYEDLFEEKVNLFAELRKGGPVTWQGNLRTSLHTPDVVPFAEAGAFPAWIGVGGSPQSVVRAARYGFSLMLAIIGGSPARFRPFSQLFLQALEKFGRDPLPVGVHSPGHVADTDEKALEEFWPRWLNIITKMSKVRGFAIPTMESFKFEVEPRGALFIGSPETVAQKIAANLTILGANRFDLKFGMPGLSPDSVMKNVELYGTKVIPRVRELLAESTGRDAPQNHLRPYLITQSDA